MSLARDIIDQAQALVAQRQQLERTWELIANLMFPHPDRQFRRGSMTNNMDALEGWAMGSKAAERAAKVYDTTAIVSLERLTTGMISLICPDNEKWQGLKVDDPLGYEMNDAEDKWAEKQRDYLFALRYDPRSGWALANQGAIRSASALGTGAYIVEEAWGKNGSTVKQMPYCCTNLPLSDNYLTVDGQGFHDQDFRFMSISARQAALLFGTQLSSKLQAQANDPTQAHRMVNILHYVGQKQDAGPMQGAAGSYPVASIYLEVDTEHVIRRSGFRYWPIIVYTWNQIPGSPYGESAAMLVLSEVQGANILAKNNLLGAQQFTRPPVATVDDAAMNRPNLNPGALNYGALTETGQLKIQPIHTIANPSFSQVILDAQRNQIREGLYTNLWQILINNPQMTATEALIRANEKGELLGPVGTRIQHGLSRLTDAELQILADKGAWDQNSPLAPPASLQGRNLSVKFTSPLERLRRSGELVGIQQTLGVVSAIAAFDPSVTDNVDGDEVFKVTREVTGAPASIVRDAKERDAMRQMRQRQQQLAAAQQIADVAKTGAEAAAAGVPAVQQLGSIIGARPTPAPAPQ